MTILSCWRLDQVGVFFMLILCWISSFIFHKNILISRWFYVLLCWHWKTNELLFVFINVKNFAFVQFYSVAYAIILIGDHWDFQNSVLFGYLASEINTFTFNGQWTWVVSKLCKTFESKFNMGTCVSVANTWNFVLGHFGIFSKYPFCIDNQISSFFHHRQRFHSCGHCCLFQGKQACGPIPTWEDCYDLFWLKSPHKSRYISECTMNQIFTWWYHSKRFINWLTFLIQYCFLNQPLASLCYFGWLLIVLIEL